MPGSYYQVEPGETLKLFWQSSDKTSTLYPQATIKDASGTTIATVNLSHSVNGLYTGTTTLSSTGNYTAQIIVYTDAGYTTESGVDAVVTDSICATYSFKPIFGGAPTGITKEEIEAIRKPLEEMIKELERKLRDELKKKSEFDPKEDLVKTDIKIPQINLREIKDELNKLLLEIRNKKEIKVAQKDYSSQLKKIEALIGSIKIPEVNLLPLLESINNIQFPKDEILNLKNLVLSSGKELSGNINGLPFDEIKSKLDQKAKKLKEISDKIAQIDGEQIKNKDIKQFGLLLLETKMYLTTIEKMLEVLNTQEDKRFKELKNLLIGIMYLKQLPKEENSNEEILLSIQGILSKKEI